MSKHVISESEARKLVMRMSTHSDIHVHTITELQDYLNKIMLAYNISIRFSVVPGTALASKLYEDGKNE